MKPIFLTSNDPRLVQASSPVPLEAIGTPELNRDLDYMYKVAYGEQGERTKPILVGVSASQLGIAKRIVLVDVAADGHGGVGDLRAFINPVITQYSPEEAEWYEGCYSTSPICGVVARSRQIIIEAISPDGTPIKTTYKDYVARIIQHEIDHLDGKVFIDRITNPSHLHWVEDQDWPKYRDAEGWRNWPKKATLGQWEEIKRAS